jgi:carbamate kinase
LERAVWPRRCGRRSISCAAPADAPSLRRSRAGKLPFAALLLVLTDVDAVYAHWRTPEQRPLARLSVAEAEVLDRDGAFGEGSMAPKVRAAIDFVRRTGGRAIITSLARGQAAIRGVAGTTLTADERG